MTISDAAFPPMGRRLGVPDEITVERLQHGQEVGVGEAALDELLFRDDAVAVNVQRVEDVQSTFHRIHLKKENIRFRLPRPFPRFVHLQLLGR